MKRFRFSFILLFLLTGCVEEGKNSNNSELENKENNVTQAQDRMKISAWHVEGESDTELFERIIPKEPAKLPYVALKQKISVVLPDSSSSSSYKIQDLILNEDGTSKYESSAPYPFRSKAQEGIVSFTVPVNPLASYSSNSADYEPGNSIRGFKLISEQNDEVFAFVLRTDAR